MTLELFILLAQGKQGKARWFVQLLHKLEKSMQLITYPSLDALHQNAVQKISLCIENAIQTHGRAYLAVPGGNTPKPIFEMLSNVTLDWQKVTVTLTDERCIHPSLSESNAYLVKTSLLKNKASLARFVSLYDPMLSSEENLVAARNNIATLPFFDCVFLGMGEDGHIASLFPGSSALETSLMEIDENWALLNTRPPNAPYSRITLTIKTFY